MKKSIFGIIAGLFLGMVLMIGVIFVLNLKPVNEDMMAQNKDEVNTQTQFPNIDSEESEFTEGIWEDETSEEEEVVVESEQTEVQKPQNQVVPAKKPVNYPYYIRVNRQANCVTIYTKDANGNYTVPVKAMTCSVGLTGITPSGVSQISERYVWRALFGGTYGQYTVRFNGHILFHSVPYSKTSKDALVEGQYNMLGQPASQGCVRLSAIDAKWIYDNCKNGTKVEVYDSPDPGPLGKPATYKISPNSPYRGWDPTDPDPANPWKKGKVNIYGVKNIVVNQGETVNLLSGVTAKDIDGLGLQVDVSNNVDFNTPGVYTITYRAVGVLGTTETVNATVTVNAIEQPDVPEVPDIPVEPEDSETTEETENTEIPEIPEETMVSE